MLRWNVKMSLKILLISPIGLKKILGADFFFKLPFLGLPTVAAHTPPDCAVKMVDERIRPVDFDADADLIGISVMTPLATRAYEVADEFRRRGKTVVMGGMHVSALPEEALEHCDAVAIGEGEKVWPQMVEDFRRGELREIYRADGADYTPLAEQKIKLYTDLGWGNLSLNMAKTHLSLSHDPEWKGVPKKYRVPIRDIRASVGAGFLDPLLGEMRTMPGLPSQPAFWPVDIDERGITKGLF